MNKIKVKDDPTEAPSINADTLYFIRLQFIKPFVEAIVVGTNVDISIKSRSIVNDTIHSSMEKFFNFIYQKIFRFKNDWFKMNLVRSPC